MRWQNEFTSVRRGRGEDGKVAEVGPHRKVGTEPKAICISHRVFWNSSQSRLNPIPGPPPSLLSPVYTSPSLENRHVLLSCLRPRNEPPDASNFYSVSIAVLIDMRSPKSPEEGPKFRAANRPKSLILLAVVAIFYIAIVSLLFFFLSLVFFREEIWKFIISADKTDILFLKSDWNILFISFTIFLIVSIS